MKIKQFLQSHTVAIIIASIGILVFLMGAFSLGERVGYHKAAFAFQNGDNFYRTFGQRSDRMMLPVGFSDAHGSVGKVLSISLPNLIVEDKDGTEKTPVSYTHLTLPTNREV